METIIFIVIFLFLVFPRISAWGHRNMGPWHNRLLLTPLHEGGHYVAAIVLRLEVEKASFFFPEPIIRTAPCTRWQAVIMALAGPAANMLPLLLATTGKPEAIVGLIKSTSITAMVEITAQAGGLPWLLAFWVVLQFCKGIATLVLSDGWHVIKAIFG